MLVLYRCLHCLQYIPTSAKNIKDYNKSFLFVVCLNCILFSDVIQIIGGVNAEDKSDQWLRRCQQAFAELIVHKPGMYK